MIGCATVYAGTSSTHSLNDVLIGNLYIDSIINPVTKLCQCLFQYFSLRNGSREAIQNITVLAVILCNTVKKDLNSQFIGNKKTLIHVLLSFFSKLCTVLDVVSENVSRRNMGNTVLLCYHFCLCAFSGSRCA